MTFFGGLLLVLVVIAVYLAMLATWALLRDPTINTAGRVARILVAWVLPLGGPASALRSVAELSPESMPPRVLLAPFSWLLFVPPRKPNMLAADDEATDATGYRNHD